MPDTAPGRPLGTAACQQLAEDVVRLTRDGVWRLDEQGCTTFVNDRLSQLLDRPESALLGQSMEDVLDAESARRLRSLLNERAVSAEAEREPVELSLRSAEGRELLVQVAAAPTNPSAPFPATLLLTDVAERRRTEHALQSQERFRGAFRDAPIAMAMIDVDERFLEVNEALCRLTGVDASDLLGRQLDELTLNDEEPADPDHLPVLGTSGAGERLLRRPDGELVWVSVHVRLWSEPNQPTRLLLQVVDISERKHYEAQLRHLGEHDPLTGLANRRQLGRELERHAARVQRHGPVGAVLLLDLDNFKTINDTLGHSAGDRVIVGVANLLRSRVRGSDLVARLGGDEFAVLLPDVEANAALQVARDLAASLTRERIKLTETQSYPVTTSIGVALFDSPTLSAEDVLARADQAMYQAKDEGPGRVSLYSSSVVSAGWEATAGSRGMGLLAALRAERYLLLAQPIADLGSGRVTHYELLLRLLVGERVVRPSAFLPVAARHGLATAVDAWVLEQAVALVESGELGESRIALNVGGRSLTEPGFLARAEDLLETLPAGRLVLEVSETSGLPDLGTVQRFMQRLRGRGVSFSLDDFGVGFGSLHHLRELPFDYLKIDGEFVRELHSSPADQAVVSSLVSLAHGLGLSTVAESVDDADTLDELRRFEVDLGQGDFLGEARPLAELAPRAAGSAGGSAPTADGEGYPAPDQVQRTEPMRLAATSARAAAGNSAAGTGGL